MIKNFFGKDYLLTNLSTFLDINSLLALSSANHFLKKILDPSKNIIINKIFYKYLNKRFFEKEDDDKYDSHKSYKERRNHFINIYGKNTTNWKSFLFQLAKHFKDYPNKNILKKVKDNFRIYLYLPDLRHDNLYLKFPNSSLYQSFLYIKVHDEIYQYSHYDKYINKDYINKQSKECVFQLYTNNLSFKFDLINFYRVYNEINSCYDYKNILESISNYDFVKLDNFYEKVNKDSINNILYFILWTNRIFKYYCSYILFSLYIFEDYGAEKYYLEEYINKYNNFVCSMHNIDSLFENVNIFINYLISFILKKNDSQKFSLLELAIKIFKKTVYDKISEKIFNKTCLLYKKILINILKNENKGKNEDNINIEEEEEINDISKEDNNKEAGIFDLQRENTEKEIIENLLICLLDFSINKNNIKDINHSYIKLDESYENYENNFIKITEEIIEQELLKGMPISEIFEKFKILLENDGIPEKNIIKSSNSFVFINKTKKNILDKTFQLLFKKLLQQLNHDINSSLELHMKGGIISISNMEKINNKKYSYDLSAFSQNIRKKIENKVQDELNKVKSFLYEQNLKGYEVLDINKLVNEYIENNDIQLVLLMKKMIYFYYKECEYYDENNRKNI